MSVARLLAAVEQVSLLEAIDAFLAERDLLPSSRLKYRATLEALAGELGAATPVADVAGRQLVAFMQARWAEASPATWNRHRSALCSLFAYCRRQGWLVQEPTQAVERRKDRPDRARWLPQAELERLWSRPSVPLRERCLWVVLYETAARAQEVLGLDVEDLDLPNRRAVVTAKGGAREQVFYGARSARMLARLISGRRSGPVFLADKRPSPARAPAAVDVDPASGRARLSYRRAAELFTRYSGGRTLHQIRHSSINDLAEDNVSLPLIMAKSRHRSLRSLQRYARPGPAAVAALTASRDPERRRP